MSRLIDIKLERQKAPLGMAILSVYFVSDSAQKIGYQWPIELGDSPQEVAFALRAMADGIEKQIDVNGTKD